MTLDEFYAEVGKIEGWYISRSGYVRVDIKRCCHCPLEAVASRVFPGLAHKWIGNYKKAAFVLGLSRPMDSIIGGADGFTNLRRYRRHHKRLLAATDLTDAT